MKVAVIGFAHQGMVAVDKASLIAKNQVEVVAASKSSLEKNIESFDKMQEQVNLTITAVERFDEVCFIKPEKHYLPQFQKHRKKRKYHN